MKKIFSIIFLLVVLFLFVSPIDSSADTQITSDVSWTKISKSEKGHIPSSLRGTYFMFNFLRRRVERIKISKQYYAYSYRKSNGHYADIQKFATKGLSVKDKGSSECILRGKLGTSKNREKVTFEKTSIKKSGRNLIVHFMPFGRGEITAHKFNTFRPYIRYPKAKPQKLTLNWLKGKKFVQGRNYQDSTYKWMEIRKNGRISFNWSGDRDTSVGMNYEMLNDANGVSVDKFIPDKKDASKGTLLMKYGKNDYSVTWYSSLAIQRVSVNFVDCSNSHFKSYNHHSVGNIKSLNSRLLVKP